MAWVANDAPPPWLQPALSRALVAMAEGRSPEPLVAPATAKPAADPDGTYAVPGVGAVALVRHGATLRVRLRGVDCQGFPVAHGVRCVPGLDAYLRVGSLPQGQTALSWDAVYVVAPQVLRAAPGAAAPTAPRTPAR